MRPQAWIEPREQPRTPPLGDVRFRKLLPAEDWFALPETVHRRFSHRASPGESHVYAGHILETRMSRVGLWLAHLLRIVGAPLPLERDNAGAAAIVAVTERPDGCGQFWSREYVRRAGFPQVIHSTKRFSGPTGIEETVGCGITMSLRLEVRPNALYFLSHSYFIRIGPIRIPIPGALVVGRIAVGHIDRGGGAFEFTLDVEHPAFGRIIRQRALFHDLAHTGATQ